MANRKRAVKKAPQPNWRRHFFYRKESLRTTWKLRLLVLLLFISGAFVTRGIWTERLAQRLVCTENIQPADALLVENFDPDYLLFERAAELKQRGVAPRVLTLVKAGINPEAPDILSSKIALLMAEVARLHGMEFIPIEEIEPITLNAAYQARDFLVRENVKSVVVVTRNFRSRRSLLVYEKVFGDAGIRVGCAPVHGLRSPDNWTESNHGLQEIFEQFVKLQYYRFYVLW